MKLGQGRLVADDEKLAKAFAMLDTDNNGTVDQKEFMAWWWAPKCLANPLDA
eukprot:SAG11_NODE_15_length_26319_cov_13.810564_5_plen_52_part_00